MLAYRYVIPKPIHKGLALRRAYEEALRLAVNPVEEADDEEKDAATEHEILRVFRALLDSENDRFQPSARRNLFSN